MGGSNDDKDKDKVEVSRPNQNNADWPLDLSRHPQDFDLPWVRELDNNPEYTVIPNLSLTPYPDTTQNGLVAETLHNSSAVRGMRTYLRYHPPPPPPPPPRQQQQQEQQQEQQQTPISLAGDTASAAISQTPLAEALVLFSVGAGVNSIAHTAHGGFTALMLDQVTGEFAATTFGRDNIVTAEMTIKYRRRLSTPRVVLCRSWLVNVTTTPPDAKGREDARTGTGPQKATTASGEVVGDTKKRRAKRLIRVAGSIEDGEGGVFATGDALFVWVEDTRYPKKVEMVHKGKL